MIDSRILRKALRAKRSCSSVQLPDGINFIVRHAEDLLLENPKFRKGVLPIDNILNKKDE